MKINNLTKIYKTEYELVKALNDMTLEFPQKGLIFIVGVSGSGKSTLAKKLGKYYNVIRGRYTYIW